MCKSRRSEVRKARSSFEIVAIKRFSDILEESRTRERVKALENLGVSLTGKSPT